MEKLPPDVLYGDGEIAEEVSPSPFVSNDYEHLAQQYYKQGLIVGAGDATIKVKDQLKAIGCKWDALHSKWVAPNAATLATAKLMVQQGPKGSVAQGASAIANKFRNRAVTPASSSTAPASSPFDFDRLFEGTEEQQNTPEPPLSPSLQVPALQHHSLKHKKRSKAERNHVNLARGSSTQELVEELVRRGVIYPAPETLGDALLDRPPSQEEMEQVFATFDEAFKE